jgi:hypothetical protein
MSKRDRQIDLQKKQLLAAVAAGDARLAKLLSAGRLDWTEEESKTLRATAGALAVSSPELFPAVAATLAAPLRGKGVPREMVSGFATALGRRLLADGGWAFGADECAMEAGRAACEAFFSWLAPQLAEMPPEQANASLDVVPGLSWLLMRPETREALVGVAADARKARCGAALLALRDALALGDAKAFGEAELWLAESIQAQPEPIAKQLREACAADLQRSACRAGPCSLFGEGSPHWIAPANASDERWAAFSEARSVAAPRLVVRALRLAASWSRLSWAAPARGAPSALGDALRSFNVPAIALMGAAPRSRAVFAAAAKESIDDWRPLSEAAALRWAEEGAGVRCDQPFGSPGSPWARAAADGSLGSAASSALALVGPLMRAAESALTEPFLHDWARSVVAALSPEDRVLACQRVADAVLSSHSGRMRRPSRDLLDLLGDRLLPALAEAGAGAALSDEARATLGEAACAALEAHDIARSAVPSSAAGARPRVRL